VNPETPFYDHEPHLQWASLRVLFLQGAEKTFIFSKMPPQRCPLQELQERIDGFCDRETGFLGSRTKSLDARKDWG
jgi:hypothetical protein